MFARFYDVRTRENPRGNYNPIFLIREFSLYPFFSSNFAGKREAEIYHVDRRPLSKENYRTVTFDEAFGTVQSSKSKRKANVQKMSSRFGAGVNAQRDRKH
jgi:hypothetical protein